MYFEFVMLMGDNFNKNSYTSEQMLCYLGEKEKSIVLL